MGGYFDTFPGGIYHQGRYEILSRVVYGTREGIDSYLLNFPSNHPIAYYDRFYVKSIRFDVKYEFCTNHVILINMFMESTVTNVDFT